MKVAYHRIQLPDGQVVEGPVVVEFDALGHFQSWHPLCGEEPFTQWRGGTFCVLKQS